MRWTWFPAAWLGLAACTSPRQIVLSIDTTLGVPCDIDRIRIGTRSGRKASFERSLVGARLPLEVTLLDETPAGSFDLEVTGLRGDVEILQAIGPMRFSGRDETATVLLDSRCTPATPCQLSDVAELSATPRAACRYAASPALDPFEDMCNVPHTDVMFGDSTAPILLPLGGVLSGAGFQLYGRPIDEIWVSRNGYLSFTQDSPDPGGVLTPGPLDRHIVGVGAAPPLQSVMAFWDTLHFPATPGTVRRACYGVPGTVGNRLFRLTWENACFSDTCAASDSLTFTVTVEEKTQRVAIHYGDMTASDAAERANGISATVGLVHDANGCPADECTLASGLCKDRLTPCGYSQVFTDTVQMPKPPNMQFLPVSSP